ncbi:MAG: hypothetical protein ACYS22_00290 [Planctomycetota bacterium]|jgi:hypothetical protein
MRMFFYYSFFLIVSLLGHWWVIRPDFEAKDKEAGVAVSQVVEDLGALAALQEKMEEAQRSIEETVDELIEAEKEFEPEAETESEQEPQPKDFAIQQELDKLKADHQAALARARAEADQAKQALEEERVRSQQEQEATQELTQAERDARARELEEQKAAEAEQAREREQELMAMQQQLEDERGKFEEERARLEQERKQLAQEKARAEALARQERDRATEAEKVAAATRKTATSYQGQVEKQWEELQAQKRAAEQKAAALQRDRDRLAREASSAKASEAASEQARQRAEAKAQQAAAAAQNERARREEAERAASVASRRATNLERDLESKLKKLSDYERYQASSRAEDSDLEKIPALEFEGQGRGVNDFLKFMAFYEMRTVVFPNIQKPWVAIYDHRTERFSRVDDKAAFERFWREHSRVWLSMDLRNSDPLWRGLSRSAALKFGETRNGFSVAQVFPHRTARYFAWRQKNAMRQKGIDPSQVERCYGVYRQTSQGTWEVSITRIKTRDGRVHVVS